MPRLGLQPGQQCHEVDDGVDVPLAGGGLPQGANGVEATEGGEAGDVGAEEEEDDIEVIDGAGEHLAAEEVEGGEHLVDGEEPLVPLAELQRVVDDNRHEKDVDAAQ